ncbi:hypothetical protein LOTGIDRAFT_171200 [Lottia gigantea]|uniref:G-protein coupled receptors family 2 profile 2 domain-containing protein n=1 Tax=Lottia gigantea TaxID=225164 RepID=V4AHX2_LOTGI|nr:hypothetical protein LOTGIDRAFT_171200 [Lottia gigantea]ESP03669.1 hypothetical protein LOTGIDRAFT_171200 [Lottia gigantea]
MVDTSLNTVSILGLILSVAFLEGHLITDLVLEDCAEPSCKGRCFQERFNASANVFQCRCDLNCSVYQDCCYDYNETCTHIQASTEPLEIQPNTDLEILLINEHLTCNSLIIIHNVRRAHYWMIGKCPKNYPQDKLKMRCEDVEAHPYSKVPVTAAVTKRHFRNIYCAFCHEGISFRRSKYIFWKSDIFCKDNYSQVTFSDISKKLENGKCSVRLVLPNDMHNLRSCLPLSVSQACHNHTGLTSSDCQSHQRVVWHPTSHRLFKNPSCASCEGIAGKISSGVHNCVQKYRISSFWPSTGGVMFNFDFSGATLNSDGRVLVPHIQSCKIDEVYDEVFDLCSRLYCPSGFAPINGNCVTRRKMHEGSFIISIGYNDSGNVNDTEKLVQRLETELSYYSSSWHTRKQKDYLIHIRFRSNFSVSILLTSVMEVITQFGIGTSDSIINLMFGTSGSCRNITRIESTSDFLEFMANKSDNVNFRAILIPIENQSVEICYHRTMPNCTSIKYEEGQFSVHNDTVQISDSGQLYSEDEFVIYKNSVYICRNLSRYYTDMLWEKFFSVTIDSTLSAVVVGVSITSCLMTLLAYLVLPHLRNGPGKIIMSMTLSLLLAQSFGRIFQLLTDPTNCSIFGAITHSLWLSVFLWTSVMMVDIARSMRISGQTVTATTKYVIYAAMAWLLPALVVALLSTLDGLDVAYFGYGYSYGNNCWIIDPNLAFYTVGIPMILCMIINTIGFIIIIAALIPKAKVLGKTVLMSRKRQLAKIFFKLSMINGGTWFILLLANLTQLEFMWYLNVLFNGLSGLYIFLSFVCNKKVLTALKEKCLLRSRSQTLYTTHS